MNERVNPKANPNPTTPWIIEISTGQYLIDESTDMQTIITCDEPCANCDTITTFCTGCHSYQPYLYDNTCFTRT